MKASSGAALSAARACWSWEFFRFKRRNLAAPMEGDALFQRNHLFLRFLAGRAFGGDFLVCAGHPAHQAPAVHGAAAAVRPVVAVF